MADAAGSYIADVLKRSDRDRYYATLVLPAATREAVQALYAFSADIAAIPDRVRDPTAGEIRLQWWRDALAGEGHGDVARNPLAAALLDAVTRFRLPAAPLLQLLEARSFDLYNDPMPDLPAFEGYAGATVSVPCQLAAMILNGAPVEPGDAAGHLGVAHAFVGHLTTFGHNARRGRIFLPWSIFAANGVEREEVLTGTLSEGLLAALGQIHELAAEHLTKAKAAISATPKHLRPAFATIALLPWELRVGESTAETPFGVPRSRTDWQKIAALSWWAWRNG